MIWGLVVGMFITIPFVFFWKCYKVYAFQNKWFTFGRENRVIYIMLGKKFSGIAILPSKTLYLEENYDIKRYEDLPANHTIETKKPFSILGMYWVGVPPFYSVYERRQQWMEWKSLPGGKREILLRDELTPFLIAKPFEYVMMAEEVEDANRMPLDIYFTVTLFPLNAVLPIFGNDNAYGQVQTKCLSKVLEYIKEKAFSDLGGDNDTATEIRNDEFSVMLRSLNEQIPGNPTGEGIEKILGYRITDAKLEKVVIAGDHKDILFNASVAEYIEKQNALAVVAKAEGAKKSTILAAEGLKEATIIKAEGDKIAGMLGVDVEKYSMEIRNAFYEAIKDKPHAQQIELAKKMFQDSKLTTFVSGKDVSPVINVAYK